MFALSLMAAPIPLARITIELANQIPGTMKEL